ncbi:hypothetical protein D9619_002975 [Psilocybe cf. subviscida]|uniref:Uncharacterized protein n=1 Tax=Psilocybe cf. subviscida TaxID=2480587 RepID=A0A8H5AWE8_9AGAR|nr:hypothetical protein D9619_002975 [Psilocybe cf. subviscida]
MFRSAITSFSTSVAAASPSRAVVARSLYTTPVARGAIKDAAEQLNLKAGKTLASALDTAEKVTEKASETVGVKTEETKQKANELGADLKQKGNEVRDLIFWLIARQLIQHAKAASQTRQTADSLSNQAGKAAAQARDTKESAKHEAGRVGQELKQKGNETASQARGMKEDVERKL